MAAGGPGDHPLTDIIYYNLRVYNAECDGLIKQISKLVSVNMLFEMFNWPNNFYVTESQLESFKVLLIEKLEELQGNAKANGWEI